MTDDDNKIEERNMVQGKKPPRFIKEPILKQKLLSMIEKGNYITTSCEACGISPSTLAYWRTKAREGKEPYVSFFAELREAERRLKLLLQRVFMISVLIRGIGLPLLGYWKGRTLKDGVGKTELMSLLIRSLRLRLLVLNPSIR